MSPSPTQVRRTGTTAWSLGTTIQIRGPGEERVVEPVAPTLVLGDLTSIPGAPTVGGHGGGSPEENEMEEEHEITGATPLDLLEDAHAYIVQAKMAILRLQDREPARAHTGRELAMVRTKLDEAQQWLRTAGERMGAVVL